MQAPFFLPTTSLTTSSIRIPAALITAETGFVPQAVKDEFLLVARAHQPSSVAPAPAPAPASFIMASVDPFAAYKQQQQEQLQDDKKKKAEYRENLNARLMCGECKEDPPNLTEEFSSGDLVCATCGLVLGDRIIDTRSEWRTFANDENNDDPSRVGDAMNPLLNGSQLETSIAFGEGGRARELHRAQNRSQLDKATKGLLAAYGDISSLCDAVHIPKTVQESAKHIYKMTDDAKLFKGKSQESIIAGCIFIACRQARLGRTFKEIHGLTNVSKKEIGRTFKQLEKFLMTQREHDSANANLYSLNEYENTNSTGAEELCGRYCSQLDFLNPHQVEKYAKALARKSTSVKDLAGRSPLSVAAACIYMICNLLDDPRPSRDIATAAGVSDGTIKTAYKYLYQAKDELIEKSWLKPEGPGNMAKLPSN